MKILISNDDGFEAPGLTALVDALKPFGHITVVAPEKNASTTSSSLTLGKTIAVRKISEAVYAVGGTPADCVHLALTGLLDFRPDLVVSGINAGCNLGDDTLYSGTVACAIQGYLFGIDSVAVSQTETGWKHLDVAAGVARKVVEHMLGVEKTEPRLINVNVPMVSSEQLKGIKITRLGRRAHACACIVEENGARIGREGAAFDVAEDTDFYAVAHGYASVSPLKIDFSHREALKNVSTWIRGFE